MAIWATGERITAARLNNQEVTSLHVVSVARLGFSQFDSNGNVELGIHGSGDRFSHIDFHSSDGSDFDFRVIRSPGANSDATLQNQGSGKIILSSAGGTEIQGGRAKLAAQTTYSNDAAAGSGGV